MFFELLQMRSNCGEIGELLYEPSILKKLDFSKAKTKFEPKISAANPGEGLLVRPLSVDDFDKGMLFVIRLFLILIKKCVKSWIPPRSFRRTRKFIAFSHVFCLTVHKRCALNMLTLTPLYFIHVEH
jgi:hypothetical protein